MWAWSAIGWDRTRRIRSRNDKNRCERLVGNTVDVEKATYTNDIGEPLLMA